VTDIVRGRQQMPYSDQRVVHDADAHIMETPTWLAAPR